MAKPRQPLYVVFVEHERRNGESLWQMLEASGPELIHENPDLADEITALDRGTFTFVEGGAAPTAVILRVR
jgi:hypothetical protein